MTRKAVPIAPRARAAEIPASPSYAVGPPIDGAAALEAALTNLRARDPDLVAHMVDVAGPPPLRLRPAGFEGLAAIVVSQQVSTASAGAILGRLRAAVVPFEPAILLAMDDDALRGCGLSIQKIRALRCIAEAVLSGALPLGKLAGLPAEQAAGLLLAVKGIGPWTADVFLLFCLGHADAWPAGDIALQEAARIVLNLDRRPDSKALHGIGERWRPYRGVAARLLWSYYRVAKGNREGIVLNVPPPDGA